MEVLVMTSDKRIAIVYIRLWFLSNFLNALRFSFCFSLSFILPVVELAQQLFAVYKI